MTRLPSFIRVVRLAFVAVVALVPQLQIGNENRVALAETSAEGHAADAWDEARRLYLGGEFVAARAKIEEVMAQEPDRYDTWEAWVATHRPGPRLDEAEKELKRRLAEGSEDPRLLFAQALATRCAGDLERASRLFAAAAELDPAAEVIPYEHRMCFADKHPRFRQSLEEARRRNPNNLTVLGTWIWLQLQVVKREPDEVEAELLAEYGSDPDSVLDDFALGAICRYREPNTNTHKRRGVELLEKVVAARPRAAKAWELLAELHRQLGENARGLQAIEQGQATTWWWPSWFDELEYLTYSRDGAKAAVEQSRRFTEYFPNHCRAWAVLGLDLSDIGQKEEGIAALREAIKLDWQRQKPTPRWNLAYALGEAGRHSEALPMYLETLDVDPGYLSDRDVPAAIIKIWDGLSSEDRRRLDEWIDEKETALPNDAWPVLMRGRIAAAQERHDEAAEAFRTVAERFPDDASEALTRWGKMLVEQKMFLEAKARFLDALHRDVAHSQAFHGALQDLLDDKKLPPAEGDQVVQALRSLAEENPYERQPLIYLGDALEKLGDQRGEHQLYEAALVPRLKLCARNAKLTDLDDGERRDGYRKVARLYAALGDFDESYLFQQRAGDEAYQEAAELQQRANRPTGLLPQSRKREAETPPRVFEASNVVGLSEDNRVNLRNANYLLGLTDVSFGEPTLLKLRRYYNSRSLHRGLFGFGWTTLFETEVGYDDSGNVAVLTASGLVVKFKASLLQRLAEEVLRRWTLDEKTVAEEERRRLGDDSAFLIAEARKIGILRPKNVDTGASPMREWKWLIGPGEQLANPLGKLFVQDEQLVFYDAESKNSFRWNKEGYLDEISHPVLGRVRLDYEDGRLAKVTEPASGSWIGFEYDDAARVKRAADSKGREAVYVYAADGDCLASRDASGKTLGFLYDRRSNLTALRHAGRGTQRMRYHTSKDWILSLESHDNNLKYVFDYYDYPLDKGALYATDVRSFWNGKPTPKATVTYGEMALHKESGEAGGKRFVGMRRQHGEGVYKLARNPLTETFSTVVMNRRRSVLEWDGDRPERILKPDGGVVHFSYRGGGFVIDTVKTESGDYQFHHQDGVVERLSGPRQFHARIKRKGLLPSRIEGADWTIELIRDEAGAVVDYGLLRAGRRQSVGREAVERLRRAMNADGPAWKLGRPIDWPEDRDNADLQFVLARFEQLFDALSRSTLPEHSLACNQCFTECLAKDLKGYELEMFEKQFLPK